MNLWWLALAPAAAAAPLRVEVVPDPPPPPVARVPHPAPSPLPVGWGLVTVDGEASEASWGPPTTLLPLDGGAAPPSSALRLAVSDGGLGLWLEACPPDQRAVLSVDPDGLGQAWWTVTVEDGAVRAEVCSLDDVDVPESWAIPGRSVPCTPAAGVVAARGAAGWELWVPWARPPTVQAKVQWVQTGRKKAGGTLSTWGASSTLPGAGAALDVARPGGRLRVTPDTEAGVWRVSVPGGVAPATWTWRRWLAGRLLDRGEVAVGQRAVALELPDLPRDAVVVEVRGEGAPLAPAWSASVRRRMVAMSLGDPVYDAAIELAFDLPDPRDVAVVVRGADGAVLGEGPATLPAGAGRLRVLAEPGWGDVRVEVGGLGIWDAVRGSAPTR